ncbi:universal stress protein [Peristeroidobacter agariperforans]|uniref:universal stress protein n=1 Tax=Peristeroidobacter agariperforans TaxID=268404 RepID=UPI00101BB73F|nr:universal stress protein [Peristeroidobacter agariperforans]
MNTSTSMPMDYIKRILVIVDPTATAHPSIDKAALLAEKFNARLELFVCDTKAAREMRLSSHLRSKPGAPLPTNIKGELESLAAPLRERGLDVTTETVCAEPLHVGLIDRIRHTSADLVVKDTHHHSLAQRTFLTNTDWQLIRACPVPLLLTKAAPWAQTPRVVAAVDPGHVNDKPKILDHWIIEHASLFAQRLHGELHVVHVYLPLAIIGVATTMNQVVAAAAPEELAIEEKNRRELVSALVSDYDIPPKNIHLELGGSGQMLPLAAERISADVLTMGAIARSGLKRIFVGSTAEDVLEKLPCDALIVKPPQFGEHVAL